jgi:integrase
MAKLWGGRTEELFTRMRSGMLSNTQIKQLVEDYIAYTLQQHDEERLEVGAGTSPIEATGGPVHIADRAVHNPEQDLMLTELENNRFDKTAKLLDKFLAEVNIEVDRESTQYKQLCRDIALAHVNEIHDIDCQRDMGDFSDSYYHADRKRQAEPVVAPPVTTQSSQPKHLLSDAIDKYIKDKASGGAASEGSIKEYTSTCKRFVWILGDRGIEEYTRDDLRSLVETVKLLPKNLNKNPMYRDKSLRAVLAMKPEVTISPKTVNEHIRLLRAVFDWAENEGWITSNPSKVISFVSEGKRSREKARERYTHDELKKLTDSLHDEAKAGKLKNRPERFWIPLIAMFSGMRLNEICQLQINDVKQCAENDLWYFDVNETEGVTTVKTSAGSRRVPIHPVLIELGFIEYYKKTRDSGATQVWPKLKQTQRGYKRALDNWFVNRH